MSTARGLGVQLTQEERKRMLGEIVSFYITEREEEIDVIAANEILDFFVEMLGPRIYNKAIEDTRELVKKEMEEIDFLLQVMKR